MIGIKSILYPFDLPQRANEALLYATAMALSYDAKLYLVNCVESRSCVTTEERRNIESLIDDKVERCLRFGNTREIEWEGLIREGEAAEQISRIAAEKRVELIVMQSRRRPLAATLLGSTAEAVCRSAPCPVLVTHEAERDWVGPGANRIDLKRVLVAYDFSDDAEIALRYALSFAERHNAEIHMLHVLPPRHMFSGRTSVELPVALETDFRETVRRLSGAVPPAPRRMTNVKTSVCEGHPYREVLSYAIDYQIDLISMGAHGAGHGVNALFGSNSDRVLRQAPCPVLIARPLRPAAVSAANCSAD